MLFILFFTLLSTIGIAILAICGTDNSIRNRYRISMATIFVLGLAFIPFITGLYPNYQHGKAVFVVKDNWEGGISYKSYDSNLCYPNDKDFQPITFKFSTQDSNIADKFKANVGKRVEVTYRTWCLAPARLSSTNEPLEVNPLETNQTEK